MNVISHLKYIHFPMNYSFGILMYKGSIVLCYQHGLRSQISLVHNQLCHLLIVYNELCWS